MRFKLSRICYIKLELHLGPHAISAYKFGIIHPWTPPLFLFTRSESITFKNLYLLYRSTCYIFWFLSFIARNTDEDSEDDDGFEDKSTIHILLTGLNPLNISTFKKANCFMKLLYIFQVCVWIEYIFDTSYKNLRV